VPSMSSGAISSALSTPPRYAGRLREDQHAIPARDDAHSFATRFMPSRHEFTSSALHSSMAASA